MISGMARIPSASSRRLGGGPSCCGCACRRRHRRRRRRRRRASYAAPSGRRRCHHRAAYGGPDGRRHHRVSADRDSACANGKQGGSTAVQQHPGGVCSASHEHLLVQN